VQGSVVDNLICLYTVCVRITTVTEIVAASTSVFMREAASGTTTMHNSIASDSTGWSAVQFADAALLLLKSSHNAVTQERMATVLGRRLSKDKNEQLLIGKPVLQSLVSANILSLRPNSEWSCDIPDTAFALDAITVTASSRIALHCMDTMRSQLKRSQPRGQQQNKVCLSLVLTLVINLHIALCD
jgi:hypothetical protein